MQEGFAQGRQGGGGEGGCEKVKLGGSRSLTPDLVSIELPWAINQCPTDGCSCEL